MDFFPNADSPQAAAPFPLERPAVALAILYQADRFLLQLRDDLPQIRHPGQWAFFGGHLEAGESPEQGLWRELAEEIGYQPPKIQHFGSFLTDAQIMRHVFYAPLTVRVDELQLNEGQDLGLFTIEEVRRGFCFSERVRQDRPLAHPHRQILLDFLQRYGEKIKNEDGSDKTR